MSVERAGAVTLDGMPLTLWGNELKVGDKAPDFRVLANDMSQLSLHTDSGKIRLIVSITSLDTDICGAETKRFNEAAAQFPDNVVIYVISCDLPFAQRRWCGAAGVENVKTLSDYKDVSFGKAYGTLIKESRLLSRAVFLVDEKGITQYVEYVTEIGEHPNYEAALEAVNNLAS